MKKYFLIFFLLNFGYSCFCQYEINISYSGTGVTNAKGFGVNMAYEIPLKNKRFAIKPQIAYKCNCGYLDFTGTDFVNRLYEFHTTVSYKLVENPRYELIPNLGLNLRKSYWSAQMREPLNALPNRFFITGIRGDNDFAVSSRSGSDFTELNFLTPGYSVQIQNKFQVGEKVSLLVTPFIELDYDKNQETGGGYVGLAYNYRQNEEI